MTREEYVKVFEAVCANLHGFLHSIDQKYIDNLVKSLGRTPAEAKSLGAWDWTHGIGLYGLHKIYEFTGDERYLDMIAEWFDDRIGIGLPDKNVNTVCPLLTMAFLHEKRPDDRYRAIMDEWAEWIMHDMKRTEEGGIQHEHAELENDQQLWDDTLIMTVLFLTKYGRMTGRQDYLDEAKYQFMLHAKYLYDSFTGLWYHGWSFIDRGHFAGALWGRGNCWITVFIPDYSDIMGLEGPEKRFALGLLQNQAAALRKYQSPEGLWHTLITDKTSYLEASATAGFCYGILKGIRMGYLDDSFKECGNRALDAILDNIGGNGELARVSYGTNVGRTLQHYRDIPLVKMHYGQALALLALIEGFTARDIRP
ncbi:MAG: glycoside hydrolase family 88 protein [Lachnospiraceae bacterium]|nr:glycoside hydrolase family 88 protein [Lachnospiraceae bacterium]